MNKAAAVFRLVCYTILIGLTLEVAARLDDWVTQGADPFRPYTINTLFRASEHGREGVPGKRFGKWSMNEWGYRGPSPLPGRSNVLTFGASETFGLYESPGKEYPRQLEAKLNEARDGRYNVVNIALPGMRIGRIAYLQEALDKTNARYVVVYPSPANYVGTEEPYCRQQAKPSPPERGLGDTLRIAGKVDQLTKQVLPDWVMTPLRRFSTWRATRSLTQIADAAPEATVAALSEDMRCVADVAARHGAKAIFVTHATYFAGRLTADNLNMMIAWRRFYPELSENGLLDLEARANEAVRRLGQELDVPVVDAAAAIPGGPDNFADFVHFSDAGAARMAALIAEKLLASETSLARQSDAAAPPGPTAALH